MCKRLYENITRDFSMQDLKQKGDFIHYNGCIMYVKCVSTFWGYHDRIVTIKFKSTNIEDKIESGKYRKKLSKFLIGKVKEKQDLAVAESFERHFTNAIETYQSLNNESN